MTAAILIIIALSAIFGLGLLLGALIHLGNASDERPIRVHRGEVVPFHPRRGQHVDLEA